MSDYTANVRKAIDMVKTDYDEFMHNALLRGSIRNLSLDDNQWRQIEQLISLAEERWESELDVEALYSAIQSMLAFARALLTEAKPRMQTELSRPRQHHSPENRVVLSMTVSNMEVNVRHLREHLSVLYAAVIGLDEERNGQRRAIHRQFPDLANETAWGQTGA